MSSSQVKLPSATGEFTSQAFWKQFFDAQSPDESFEWYGAFSEYADYLKLYIRKGHNVLEVGCGCHVTCIDTDEKVINTMKKRCKLRKGQQKLGGSLQFAMADATNLNQFTDGSYQIVVDKGTIDAMLPDFDTKPDTVTKVFSEVQRLLAPFGRYISISLAQANVLDAYMNCFAESNYAIRAHPVDIDFLLPAYMFVFTKMAKPTTLFEICERASTEQLCVNLRVTERHPFTSCIGAYQALKVEQYRLRQEFAPGQDEYAAEIELPFDDEIHLFKIFVVEAPKSSGSRGDASDGGRQEEAKFKYPFACFIVPLGRENEFLFATKAGRADLRSFCDARRLIVVHCSRSRNDAANALDGMQERLSAVVKNYRPVYCPDSFKIPYLSTGTELDTQRLLFEVMSELNGVVRVYEMDSPVQIGDVLRSLVFLNSPTQTQSAITLCNRAGADTAEFVFDELQFVVHRFMALSVNSAEQKVLLIGNGVGCLQMYLRKKFSNKLQLTAVEIDPCVVAIGESHFGCSADNVIVCDGLDYVGKLATDQSFVDVLLIDTSQFSSDNGTVGFTAPAEGFLRSDTDHGVLVVNFVSRSGEVRSKVLEQLKEVFDSVFSGRDPDYTNEVFFCWKYVRPTGQDSFLNYVGDESAAPPAGMLDKIVKV